MGKVMISKLISILFALLASSAVFAGEDFELHGSLGTFEAYEKNHILMIFLEGHPRLEIQTRGSDHYGVEIGSLKFSTESGNSDGARAYFHKYDQTIYFEIPTKNLIVELKMRFSASAEIIEAKVKAGSLDSAQGTKDIGRFF